jgi:uncharacterized phage infection (PIP) family protein YhgE
MASPVPIPASAPADDTSKSLSANELRRKLLAASPLPNAGNAPAGNDILPESPVPLTAAPAQPGGWGTADALARLRLPGQTSAPPAQLANDGTDETAQSRPAARRPAPYGGYGGSTGQRQPGTTDAQRLYHENAELRTLLKEMKHLLQEASANEQQFTAKLTEMETQLADKTRQADELSSQIQQIEEQIANGTLAPQVVPKTKTELEEWSDELEKESAKLEQDRKRVEQDRKQLRDDEEALEKQMRSMEVTMAKERAMMARQEVELRRLHSEIQHELEIMNRGDASLREQMAKFQRRAQDVMSRQGGGAY